MVRKRLGWVVRGLGSVREGTMRFKNDLVQWTTTRNVLKNAQWTINYVPFFKLK
jgi:hypothetical protein